MPAAKKTTPKKPTDRLAPKERELEPKNVPGMELMKDFSDVPVWDQTPLISMVQKISEERQGISKEEFAKLTEEERAEYNADRESRGSFDVNILGDIAKALMPFAKDEAAYIKFVPGKGAMERAMNLAMAWVGQMGEFGSSDDS